MRAGVGSFVLPMVLVVLVALTPVDGAQLSIPINGRYSVLTIRVFIPLAPKWAHDIVVNATIAWNRAQLIYPRSNSTGSVYTFVETDNGTATSTVSFSMPAAYASIAVGWTNYEFAPGSRTTVVSTQTYLTPTIFNAAQGNNMTARRYAFWLALHELGRILGLGSLLDGKDIMDPRYLSERVDEVPQFSTLDLYALYVLAQGNAPSFVTLPEGVQDQLIPVTRFLPMGPLPLSPVPEFPSALSISPSTSPEIFPSLDMRMTRLIMLFHYLS